MDRRPNVILLIFDTLRSDYLSCYDATQETQAFERTASRGTLFENAFGTAPGTPVSHASMYSGQYPSEHGVTGQYINLPEEIPVMADRFRDAGYETFGITGPPKMGSDWGYDRGFEELYEHYHDMPTPPSWRNISKSVTDPRYRRYFLRQLTKGGREKTKYKFGLLRDRIQDDLSRPFFTVSNIATVHSPYDPPRPYKQRAVPGYSRPSLFLFEHLLDRHGSIDDPEVRLDRVENVQRADGIGRFLADPEYLNASEVQLLRSWYAATVEYLDREFSQFLDFYERELHDDTVLVVTADHGEQLGEHGLWGHSHYFYDETLHVPLLFVGPGVPEGARRDGLVSHVDLFDTLCQLCGIDPPETTSGIDLFSEETRDAVFMEYGERDVEQFAENAHGRFLDGDQLRSFCAGRKAIRTRNYRFEVTSNGTEQLYELPAEKEVTDPEPSRCRQFREAIRETVGEQFGIWPESRAERANLDDSVESHLRELGYIQ